MELSVAVAVIFNSLNEVLITKRPTQVEQGGYWEFPGGKLEQGETASEALIREIKEEVGLEVLSYQFMTKIVHNYNDKKVHLLVFAVPAFKGTASCRESQTALQWVSLKNLSDYQFPAANQKILKRLKLLSSCSPARHCCVVREGPET